MPHRVLSFCLQCFDSVGWANLNSHIDLKTYARSAFDNPATEKRHQACKNLLNYFHRLSCWGPGPAWNNLEKAS